MLNEKRGKESKHQAHSQRFLNQCLIQLHKVLKIHCWADHFPTNVPNRLTVPLVDYLFTPLTTRETTTHWPQTCVTLFIICKWGRIGCCWTFGQHHLSIANFLPLLYALPPSAAASVIQLMSSFLTSASAQLHRHLCYDLNAESLSCLYLVSSY